MKSRIASILLVLCAANLFAAQEVDRERAIEIRPVAYANSDPSRAENRLLIIGDTAYRTVKEIKEALPAYAGRTNIRLVIHGVCVLPAPALSFDEIEELRLACEKAKIPFSYYPAG